MENKNPALMAWFEKELPVEPIGVLYNGYHAPVRYEIRKHFLLYEHDDERLLSTEQDVKTAERRISLLLTLERILKNIEKFEKSREEEMLVKLASIVKELHFYHCTRKMTSIQKALALLIQFQQKDGSFPASLASNIFIIETILEYGVVTNPYMEKALKWLLYQQNDDKGWGTTAAGYSDVWITCKALHTFSYSMKYMKNTKIKKGVEFILNHLYAENTGGILEGANAWQNLSRDYMIPGSFAGGTLSVLEMLARLNVSYQDARITGMLDWLKGRQMRSGLWPNQTYDLPSCRSDERVSIRVVRVFKLFYIMPLHGSATIKSFRIKQDGRTNSKKPGFITDPLNNPKPEEDGYTHE
ncbi:MAG: terpene cyclase/mutase family protein [Candidatus Marinimicrobia bacterium]|nr:terpene cyclase/mutase family protein [Candidatus Neomarinimicrobiota bacterium]